MHTQSMDKLNPQTLQDEGAPQANVTFNRDGRSREIDFRSAHGTTLVAAGHVLTGQSHSLTERVVISFDER